jgi:hypothetical protein
MARRKARKENRAQGQAHGKHMSESSPNPHGESKILEMPIRTKQPNGTPARNIPQVPNTVGGDLNPSVAHEFPNRGANDKEVPPKRARILRERKKKA